MSTYKYNLKRDTPDERDLMYQASIFNIFKKLPKSVDLRTKMPLIYDQGMLGSCTANAGVGLMEYLQITAQTARTPLSRLFLYWKTREREGTINEDAGAELKNTMKVMQKVGVCPEMYWPYIISDFTREPSYKACSEASKYKINTYSRVRTLSGVKAALAEGRPVVIGFEVYESFESDRTTRTGVCPMPKKGEELLGGHAVLVVGYKDGLFGKGSFIIRNSWGENWGKNGYFTMSYEVFNKLVMDMWVGM